MILWSNNEVYSVLTKGLCYDMTYFIIFMNIIPYIIIYRYLHWIRKEILFYFFPILEDGLLFTTNCIRSKIGTGLTESKRTNTLFGYRHWMIWVQWTSFFFQSSETSPHNLYHDRNDTICENNGLLIQFSRSTIQM